MKGLINEDKDRGTASIIRTMQLIDRSIEPVIQQSALESDD
jgi:hypothetical protein